MENEEELINNIKSKHILNYVFKYIEDKNFKEKLFLYSKKFQIKLDINLIGLKENYLKKLGVEKFLYIEPRSFKEDILTKKYNEFLKKKRLNKEKIENIILDVYENKEIKDIYKEDIDKIKEKEKEKEKLINIESPLFEVFLKIKNFGKIFSIHISQNIIDDYNLIDEYINLFDKLNNMNINYTSIYYYLNNINKINYLKEIHINFNKIKRLTIEANYDKGKYMFINEKDKEVENFFSIFFSINNIENNLIYLSIKFKKCNINPELFENINNFTKLKYLFIENINLRTNFIIKLNRLKLLSIISCKNIELAEMPNEELEELEFKNNKIVLINILGRISFKELNKLNLSCNIISDIDILEKVNLKKLKELNLFHNEIQDINILERVNFKELNKLNLSFNFISNINVLVRVDFKELQELDLGRNNISDINILEKVNFEKLKELDLSYNKISDINILEKANFKELNKLNLSWNKISDINILGKINYKKLTSLNLSWNKISDISIIGKVNLKELKELDLSFNNISDIDILEQVNFKVHIK